jgi:spermidine synthase
VIKRLGKEYANQLLINGRGMTRKITDTKMMAHVPMLLHPKPEKTLVICFGMGTTYRSAIAYEGHVTVVELVQEVYDAFDFFYGDAQRVRDYQKGNMITNDGRIFLKLTQEMYDIITIDPPPPIDGAGVNNLYSQDFAELAKSRLAPGGIMAHWIPFPGSKAGVDDRRTFFMLVYTFARVFPYTYAVPGWHNVGLHIIGSLQPLKIDTESIGLRMKKPSVLKDIREWDPVTSAYFGRLRLLKMPDILPPAVTDDRPLLEFNLLRTWHLQKRHPIRMP